MKWVALLRGINLGGRNRMKMVDLREMMTDLSFTNVQTYIQTGNILFSSPAKHSAEDVTKTIEVGIKKTFGHTVAALVLSFDALTVLVQSNPFLEETDASDNMHVTFLKTGAASDRPLPDPELYMPDRFAVVPGAVYLSLSGLYRDTKLNNTFWERRLKVPASTRRWRTVIRLYEMSRA